MMTFDETPGYGALFGSEKAGFSSIDCQSWWPTGAKFSRNGLLMGVRIWRTR